VLSLFVFIHNVSFRMENVGTVEPVISTIGAEANQLISSVKQHNHCI